MTELIKLQSSDKAVKYKDLRPECQLLYEDLSSHVQLFGTVGPRDLF